MLPSSSLSNAAFPIDDTTITQIEAIMAAKG